MPLPIRYVVLCFLLLVGSGGALALAGAGVSAVSESLSHAEVEDGERAQQGGKRFIVYYDDRAKAHEFDAYDVIVFDREKHPPLRDLRSKNKLVLGYISGGELELYREDYEKVRAKNQILGTSETWKDHMVVDVRNPEWTRYLIEDVIPPMVKQGFNGIFIDTLDSVVHYEHTDPEHHAGLIMAAANMVKTIHYHYPEMKIMVNRGFDVLPHIAKDINYVLAESTLVQYDFSSKTTKLVDDAVYQDYVQRMHLLKKQAPHLELVALDYWNMEDTATVKHIYQRHEANGLMPYVTTIELNRIDARPE